MQVLRFKYGQVRNLFYIWLGIPWSLEEFLWTCPCVLQIYSVNVAVFLGGNKPSRTGDVRGDISVNFSCDPDISSKLVCNTTSSLFRIAYIQLFFISSLILPTQNFFRLILFWRKYHTYRLKVLLKKMYWPSSKLNKELMKMDYRFSGIWNTQINADGIGGYYCGCSSSHFFINHRRTTSGWIEFCGAINQGFFLEI